MAPSRVRRAAPRRTTQHDLVAARRALQDQPRPVPGGTRRTPRLQHDSRRAWPGRVGRPDLAFRRRRRLLDHAQRDREGLVPAQRPRRRPCPPRGAVRGTGGLLVLTPLLRLARLGPMALLGAAVFVATPTSVASPAERS